MEIKKHNILLIEDDHAISCVVEDLISLEPSYRFMNSNTLGKGLEVLAGKNTDVILLDLNLPDSTGLDTLKTIRAEAPDIAVILLTGMSDENLAISALQAGAQDYLIKGQNKWQTLLRSIRYAIERNRVYENLKKQEKELKDTKQDLERKNEELKKAYLEMQTYHTKIIQQEKLASIGQIAAGVAHEINNPIGFVTGNLEILGKYLKKLSEFIDIQTEIFSSNKNTAELTKFNEKRRALKIDHILSDIDELISESIEGAERVKIIVANLKNFARPGEDEERTLDITECIDSTLNIVWSELKYTCEVKKHYSVIPPITCYPQQINQVFMNLLINASHAIKDKGVITIKTWQHENYVCISITDDGCGIAEENIPRLFEPFFTTKNAGRGTGLGLSIVDDIIKRHNGEILVESIQGRGTTFTVMFPISN